MGWLLFTPGYLTPNRPGTLPFFNSQRLSLGPVNQVEQGIGLPCAYCIGACGCLVHVHMGTTYCMHKTSLIVSAVWICHVRARPGIDRIRITANFAELYKKYNQYLQQLIIFSLLNTLKQTLVILNLDWEGLVMKWAIGMGDRGIIRFHTLWQQ